MNTNRHPAGTSVGGQWAQGTSAEIDIDDEQYAPPPAAAPAAEAALRRFPDEDGESGVDEGLAGRLDRDELTDVSEGLASSMVQASAALKREDPEAHTRYEQFFARASEPVDEEAADEERARHFHSQAQSYKALKSRLSLAADA